MAVYDYWTGEPTSTSNRNVPDGAEIIGRASSGETDYTFWYQRHAPRSPEYGRWALWKCGDWANDKPTPTNFDEMAGFGVPIPRRLVPSMPVNV